MPKGRGANARRRNQRLSGRKGGTQSGSRYAQALAMSALTAEWRSAPGVWRLHPRTVSGTGQLGWWRRLLRWVNARVSWTRPVANRSRRSEERPSLASAQVHRERAGDRPGERIHARRRV